jgi:hypothetical protein
MFSTKEHSKLSELTEEYKNRIVKCPQCAYQMADLGYDFKAPKKTDEKEWKIVEGLFRIGTRFYSCGCYGIGYIPQKQSDYKKYLSDIFIDYNNSLKYYKNREKKDNTKRKEEIDYWTERLNKVEKEIKENNFNISKNSL